MKKHKIKLSQARILTYLSNTPLRLHYAAEMSSKLNIGYVYVLEQLKQMVKSGWLSSSQAHGKKFYHIQNEDILSQAVERMSSENNKNNPSHLDLSLEDATMEEI